MNPFFKNILGAVIAAAIVANVAILFHFGERLARIETKLQSLTENHQLATK
jgi:hypothetical protein